MPHRKTVVFDAYGTLFDVAASARLAAAQPGGEALADHWPALAEIWRRKQLEYSWLRTLMQAHADFAEVTADALDYALEALGLHDRTLRALLLALHDRLPLYPEVPQMLATLKSRDLRLAILSNGTPGMLASAMASAQITDAIEMAISIEDAGIYKPAAAAYALVEARLGVARDRVLFVSANGWDVAGASRYGFATVWVNRAGLPMDRLPHGPNHIIPDLARLPVIV
ncbi:haloacid dehalogenase type II [Tabrizicola sp.]|uniref:haloacid dehalogenase type II n=1 Tax=Tabrizicola sp. TaxID=2005166 RepID=UPI00286A2FEE|nr:haloacid dehalogenase type II [Tabrizicola sp.]